MVYQKYYYIVYFRDFFRPVLYPVYFKNRAAAQRALAKTISKKKRAYYEVVRGDKLSKFEFKYLFKLGKLGKFTKYNYPTELSTHQSRKSYRTLLRRRLRRMGMLTLIRPKQDVRDSPEIIKLKVNRQKVAMSPNTIAMAFRLERKPKWFYYLILKKTLGKRKKDLFEVRAIRVNMKTKELKIVTIRVFKTDLIIPHLLTEIIIMYGKEETIMDALRKEGIRPDSKPQKGFLKRMRENLLNT